LLYDFCHVPRGALHHFTLGRKQYKLVRGVGE
jgi:hypothetical protein